MKNKSLKKDFIWNTLGSSIHAFNSLFFLIIVTRINGLNNSGIFSYAFTISNIFLVVATFGGRNYQVTDTRKEFSENSYKNFRFFTTIISIILFALLFLCFNYSIYKYLIIILLIIVRSLESLSDVYFGVFQKNNKLYLVGISLFLKNLIALIVFLITDYIFKNLYIPIICWGIVNLLFLVFFDIFKTKKISNEKFKLEKNYKEIFNKTLYFFLFSFISIFIINIPRYFIDFYLTDELQGIFGILLMPATMTALLTQFILQPFTVKLSESSKNNLDEFKKQVKKIFICILCISFGCILLAYLFGIPVLNLIYNLNLNNYRYYLLLVMIGSVFYALNNLLNLIYTIKRKTKFQFIIYTISTILSLIITYFLITKYELLGGIISYVITMFIVFIFYIIRIRKIINN
jgi:O-antigen/teichoic acid export membrane protein